MKIPIENTEALETPDFDRAAEHVLRKNQELYERLAAEKVAPPPPHDAILDEDKAAFSEVRRQYRNTLKKLSR